MVDLVHAVLICRQILSPSRWTAAKSCMLLQLYVQCSLQLCSLQTKLMHFTLGMDGCPIWLLAHFNIRYLPSQCLLHVSMQCIHGAILFYQVYLSVCLSDYLSVCPSNAGTVSKRMLVSSHFFTFWQGHHSSFFQICNSFSLLIAIKHAVTQ